MFSLTIAVGNGQWAFLFRSKDAAKKAASDAGDRNRMNESPLVLIDDDFGQRATLVRSAIVGVLFEDLNLTKDAAVERSLYNARGQAELQRRASSDAALKLASGSGLMQGMPHRMNG